jgi:hypothetical protein
MLHVLSPCFVYPNLECTTLWKKVFSFIIYFLVFLYLISIKAEYQTILVISGITDDNVHWPWIWTVSLLLSSIITQNLEICELNFIATTPSL